MMPLVKKSHNDMRVYGFCCCFVGGRSMKKFLQYSVSYPCPRPRLNFQNLSMALFINCSV